MTSRGNAQLARRMERTERRAFSKQHEKARAIMLDAERYRWLRDHAGNEIMRKLMAEARPNEWDKLVDQERNAEEAPR